MMIEAGGRKFQKILCDAIMFGFEECKKLAIFQEETIESMVRLKAEFEPCKVDEELEKEVTEFAYDMIKRSYVHSK